MKGNFQSVIIVLHTHFEISIYVTGIILSSCFITYLFNNADSQNIDFYNICIAYQHSDIAWKILFELSHEDWT